MGETNGMNYMDRHASNSMSSGIVLHSLNKFTSYQVEVQPYNQEGLGPASTASVATTNEDGKNFLMAWNVSARRK